MKLMRVVTTAAPVCADSYIARTSVNRRRVMTTQFHSFVIVLDCTHSVNHSFWCQCGL